MPRQMRCQGSMKGRIVPLPPALHLLSLILRQAYGGQAPALRRERERKDCGVLLTQNQPKCLWSSSKRQFLLF